MVGFKVMGAEGWGDVRQLAVWDGTAWDLPNTVNVWDGSGWATVLYPWQVTCRIQGELQVVPGQFKYGFNRAPTMFPYFQEWGSIISGTLDSRIFGVEWYKQETSIQDPVLGPRQAFRHVFRFRTENPGGSGFLQHDDIDIVHWKHTETANPGEKFSFPVDNTWGRTELTDTGGDGAILGWICDFEMYEDTLYDDGPPDWYPQNYLGEKDTIDFGIVWSGS